MPNRSFERLTDEAQLDELATLLNRSFGTTGDVQTSRDWASEHGLSALRQVRDGGALVACLVRLPMGHFIGGRSVSTLGIAGVGVPAERRGEGHAKWMMTEGLREARREGFALSSLYASTFGLYRQVGYERAGLRLVVKVDPRQLASSLTQADGASMRPLTPDDEPAVRALYESYARLGCGLLDRSEDLWRRVQNPGRKPATGAVIEEDGEPTGYARWVQLESETGQPFDLLLSDHAVATPMAAQRLLAFLASHGTMAGKVFWFGGPGEPLLSLLDTTDFELQHRADWLIRILDVEQAIESRGFPVGVDAELHLELEDELFDENAGRFVLRVSDGRGQLSPGGDGRLTTSIRAFAPLYTGHSSAAQLELTGWLRADEASCATASAIFSGPTPWMPDFF